MQLQPVISATGQMFALTLEDGDELISTLTTWATKQGISAASFTASGGFERATLAYFDPYGAEDDITMDEWAEIVVLVGTIALKDGAPEVHAHCVVVVKRDGSARGGHIVNALARSPLKVTLTATPSHSARKPSVETYSALVVNSTKPPFFAQKFRC